MTPDRDLANAYRVLGLERSAAADPLASLPAVDDALAAALTAADVHGGLDGALSAAALVFADLLVRRCDLRWEAPAAESAPAGEPDTRSVADLSEPVVRWGTSDVRFYPRRMLEAQLAEHPAVPFRGVAWMLDDIRDYLKILRRDFPDVLQEEELPARKKRRGSA